MVVIKTLQVRIYPSPKQRKLFEKQLDCHRLLYNTALEQADLAYEASDKTISTFDLIKTWVNHLRKENSDFLKCNYSSLQHTVRRFGKARQRFIDYCRNLKKGVRTEKVGQPRIKKPERFNTLEYTFGDGIHIKKNKLKIHGLGFVKVFWAKEIPKEIKYAVVTRKGEQYYATFFMELFHETKPSQTENAIGIDFGLKQFLALSDGSIINNPKFHKQDLKEHAKRHRKIHKTPKGSKEREKAKKALRKVQTRITNRRKNFNHQISRKLVNSYDILCLENIRLNDLLHDSGTENKQKANNINRSYRDVAFGRFRELLSYKAENAGKKVILVNPAYTSQTCNSCGRVAEKDLDDRVHICECGHQIDRDVNAAKNILRLGLQSLQVAKGCLIEAGDAGH